MVIRIWISEKWGFDGLFGYFMKISNIVITRELHFDDFYYKRLYSYNSLIILMQLMLIVLSNELSKTNGTKSGSLILYTY